MRTHPALEAAASRGMRLGLDRVRDVLCFLGDPHLGRSTVHVAGTNGKGSVCTMTTGVLVASGLRVGTFLSPHLVHVNERVRLDGEPVDDGTLDRVLREVEAARQAWGEAQGEQDAPLTYFELSMVAAFRVFAQAEVDVQVIEVGIGGRLDATNVVAPTVCAVTSVGLDHVEVLGPDLASIAWEKAGILKPEVPVVVGRLPPEAARVVRARAEELRCPIEALGAELRVEGDRVRTLRGASVPVRPAMAGAHQRDNAAVVVGLVEHLRAAGLAIPDEAVQEGLGSRLPGRMMWAAEDVLLDGAHNVDGAAALGRYLSERGGREERVLVFGCGQDRDPVALVAPLAGSVSRILTTSADHPRARDGEALAACLRAQGWPAEAGGSPAEALARARSLGRETVVTGSLYLLGDIVAWWSDGGPEADGS